MKFSFRQGWSWKKPDIELVLKHLVDAQRPVVHICSGSSNIGDVRIDRCLINSIVHSDGGKRWIEEYRGNPTILGDMNQIPLKDGCAGTIICDPPYEDTELILKDVFVKELVRILKPRGLILFYAPWVITHPVLKLNKIIPMKISKNKICFKLFSTHHKVNGQIGDYV